MPKLRLPIVFSNSMVLQADAELPIWGSAKPNADVTVTFARDKKTVTADEAGNWQLRLRAQPVNKTPQEMLIQSGTERVNLTDILIGEVWICSGQSNMAWTISQSTHGREELADADYPNIRLLNLSGGAGGNAGSYTSKHFARLRVDKFSQGNWKIASSNSVRNFSAVGWHFGKYLHREKSVPVGIICSAVGGTPTEAWIPTHALKTNQKLKAMVAGNWLNNNLLGDFCRNRGSQNLSKAIQTGETIPGDELGPNHPFKPGFMWATGIAPLIPYAIRGAIWYQGESNAETPARVNQHNLLLPVLISEWRKAWGQGSLPFFYVQLPALNRPHWPLFREGQRRMLGQLSNVGMAITIDTGHPTNVHPPLKKPVGERLARLALGATYNSEKHTPSMGPLFHSANNAGDKMIITFSHVGSGLKSSDDKPLRHFEVCGIDGVFHPADAIIKEKDTIVVSSPKVTKAKQARYAWRPFPEPSVNLINSANLPASPFLTQ